MRLNKPIFVKAAVVGGILEGVITDVGPKVAWFHRRLPNGKYAKIPTKIYHDRWYGVNPPEDARIRWEKGVRGTEPKYKRQSVKDFLKNERKRNRSTG